MPVSGSREEHPDAINHDARKDAIESQLADARAYLTSHITRHDFPRSFRGYDRDAVERHLELIVGWLSLTGVDSIVAERFIEHEQSARRVESQAETDAEQIRDDARREAERRLGEARDEADRRVGLARREAAEITERARSEAERLLADARASAAAERRGRRRLGRPLSERRARG